MVHRWYKILVPSVLALGLSGCGTGEGDNGDAAVDVPEDAEPSADVLDAQRSFGVELFQKAWEEDRNTLLSPVSAYMALAMTLNGADGDTHAEMAETLGVTENEMGELNETMQVMLAEMTSSEDVTFELANSIWAEEGRAVDEDFHQVMEEYYDASFHEVDFSDPATEDTMNDWVSDETNGMIDDLVDGLDPDMVMMLVNALYFQGDWTLPFDEEATYEETFTTASGEEETVNMMTETEDYAYGTFDGYEAVELPYGENEDFSMIAALPDEDADPGDVLNSWQDPEWLEELDEQEVQVNFPSFEIEEDNVLHPILQEMSMIEAFDSEAAEFPHLFAEGGGGFFISGVQQMTKMEVTEEGTEAAAATGVGVTSVSSSTSMTFDRPFFLLLMENETKTPLFMGYVENPAD
ncbi:serpin B [Geomicrobium halophilum]|uniref:Serpin B n=1 Tax=Geomicrobium halophilum TaxID=549000 RepID=A0A841Q0J4_9BACL|nr:serpin family protein [Geomicrobium halophilum]MBB6451062.1 serpin B [Geomicrobium halophilum]